MTKRTAHAFLSHFERILARRLATVAHFSAAVRERALAAKDDPDIPHLRRPEEVFLNEHAIPCLAAELKSYFKLSDQQAAEALLAENFRHLNGASLASPVRSAKHPFDKTFAPDPLKLLAHWQAGKANSLRQSCPDFALRSPAPCTVVFEGKYFDKGTERAAAATLVKNIYQAFFYRALPKVAPSRSHAAWDYEYSCLLACDASPEGRLHAAWNGIPPAIREGFWDGANVYVMILRANP